MFSLSLTCMPAGISGLISNHPEVSSVIDYTDEDEDTKTACNKDTGTRHKLQKWTRGHLFVVRGGGHIWKHGSPYTSECQMIENNKLYNNNIIDNVYVTYIGQKDQHKFF